MPLKPVVPLLAISQGIAISIESGTKIHPAAIPLDKLSLTLLIPLIARKTPDVPLAMQNKAEPPTAKFLSAKTFAVAGASLDRSKYGNRVFQALATSGRLVYPLNPSAPTAEGHPAFVTIVDLPEVPESLSIVTPPQVTRRFIQQSIATGVNKKQEMGW